MKKENKRLAQEMRAKKRAKETKNAKMKTALKFWGPVTGAALALIIIIVAIATSDGGTNSSTNQDSNDGNISADNENIASDTENITPVSSDDDTNSSLDTTEGVIIQNGDYINLDYIGYVDGEEFEGGNTYGMGTDLLIGSGNYIDGFEEGIIGHKVGETFDLNLTFPENYYEELAGKDVVFTTTINGIYKQ